MAEELLGAEVHEKTRWQRVRWILALDEIARLGRAATWEEWNKIWFRGERYTDAAAKKALTRLCADLREFGVELRCSEGRFVDGRGRELRALVEPWLERARRLDEEIDARRRKKERTKVREPCYRARSSGRTRARSSRDPLGDPACLPFPLHL